MGHRKQGMIAIVKDEAKLRAFLQQFQCDEEGLESHSRRRLACQKMNDKVDAYNVKLVALVTDRDKSVGLA